MKLVLYCGNFTREYVVKIRAELPSEFRVTETTLPENYKTRGAQFLLRIFGSRQTQANQMVKITFYNTNNHSFMVPLHDLKAFLTQFLKQPSLTSSPSSSAVLPLESSESPPL